MNYDYKIRFNVIVASRHRDRHTDIHTHRQTHIDRQTHTKTDTHKDRHTQRQTHTHTDRQTLSFHLYLYSQIIFCYIHCPH